MTDGKIVPLHHFLSPNGLPNGTTGSGWQEALEKVSHSRTDSFLIPGLSASQCTIIATLGVPFILSFPINSWMRKAVYPLHIYVIICAYLGANPVSSPATSSALYLQGLFLGNLTARIIDRLYLHQPETTFLRKGVDDKPGANLQTYPPAKKFLWGLELITAARGVGWNWQVSGIPPSRSYTQWSFVWERFYKTAITFFGIAMTAAGSRLILDGDRILGSSHLAILLPILRSSLFVRLFITAGWLTVVYGHIVLPENLLAIACVGLGIGGRWAHPSYWPPAFGSIEEAYTLRRCWGKFWHTALRRNTSIPGNFIVSNIPQLHRPRSTLVRLLKRYFLLICSFFISGLIHACGTYMVTRDSATGPSDGGAFLYFLSQPLAIMAEDLIYHLLGVSDDRRPSSTRRLMGFTFVAAFWLYTFPSLKVVPLARAHGIQEPGSPMMAAVRACGLLAEEMPFNPVKSLLKLSWERWIRS